MTTQPPPDADREYRLIEQLELRIANANTDEKFQTIIQKFLAALLLKVGSENVRNRNLAIKVCQHVNQRLKLDASISIPIESLLKAFRDAENAFVKRFALLFIEQGFARLSSEQAIAILPDVLRSTVPEEPVADAARGKMWSIAFDFLLDILRTWKIPSHATKEEIELKDVFQLTNHQGDILSDMLSAFITYDPRSHSSWKSLPTDFEPIFDKQARSRAQVLAPIAKFLFTPIFTDEQRFVPAILLSVSASDAASSVADAMFKQCNFDLEQDTSVDLMFDLFDLGQSKLQVRLLSLLARSQTSTRRATKILQIVEKQLFQDGTGLEAAKLRSAVFSYLTWAVRVSDALSSVKDKLQNALKEFVELQGWPNMSEATSTDIDLRSKAYESIGLLAAIKQPGTANSNPVSLNLITWLFTSLRCDSTRDIRASIDEGLGRILNVASFESPEDVQKLKTLLTWNVKAQEGEEDPVYFLPSVNSTRYIAVRFANKCLPFDDADARYMDILALGSGDRREVIEEGARGLDPYWHMANARMTNPNTTGATLAFPDFSRFMSSVFPASDPRGSLLQQIESRKSAVAFGRNLLVYQALKVSEFEVECQPDWSQKVEALIRNEPEARRMFGQYLGQVDGSSLLPLIKNSIIGMSLGSYDCAEVVFDLVSSCPNSRLRDIDPEHVALVSDATLKTSVQSRATSVFGIILSLSDEATDIVRQALSRCSSWSTAVGESAQAVQASLLCAGSTLTRMSLRGLQIDSGLVAETYQLAADVSLGTSDKTLKHAAYTVIAQICLCLPSKAHILDDASKLIDAVIADAKKEDEIAVMTLGRITGARYPHTAKNDDASILDRLFNLHEVRKAEFHFALGEALATAALGFHSTSTVTEFDVDVKRPDWNFHPDFFATILDRLITDSKAAKPSLRKASAIWLLSLVQYCGDAALLQPRLKDCQTAFGKLLNDRDEIVQETGSRGLSLVYQKGDKSLRDDLVRDLVHSFTGGTAKLSGTVSEDTKLFEAGALPTEGGQSVQTYKDIVSLATEMGDPSLVYRFMNLASNNAIWSSRAAFGRFGLSGVLADSTYLTENKKFYPKLFRYRFDPNPNVQRSMDDIWKALVKDPNKVIDENFDLIMSDLLKSILSGKDWRAREASCAAISDLVQGREVEKLEKHLDDVWAVAFKVLDDVKETVRVAAMKLCRTLTGMLIRNLEVGEGSTQRATTMMQHAVPFLLDRMDSGAAQEVQQYAVVTLLEIVKKSPLRSLRSFAPIILEKLILSLSSLEHESINYLHLNADKYGLTAEKLDKMRVSSINASPVSEAIERCLESVTSTVAVDPEGTKGSAERAREPIGTPDESLLPMTDAMQRLEGAFKTAIGLPSKVGLSRVMITLVVRHPSAFRPYAGKFAQLTRKYILDRNSTISVSFSTALGYLTRLASEKEVNETSRYAQKLYFGSQELAHRAVAGEIVQAISKASNDVFMNYATVFLPFAFVGRNDLDSGVRECFDPAWKENVGGSRALNLYLSEIVTLISSHITSTLWPIKQACCLAVAELVSSMDGTTPYTEAEARLLWTVVEEALNGKTWGGKEKVISAYPLFVKKASPIWSDQNSRMKAIAIREAKRANVAYRPHALVALGEFASLRPDLDLEMEALEVLTNVVETLEEEGDPMDVDGDEGQGSQARLADSTFSAVMQCLFQIIGRRSGSQVLDQAMKLVRAAHGKRSSVVDMETYDGARRYVAQATADSPSSAGAGGDQVRVPPADADQAGQPCAAFLRQLVLALFADDATRYNSQHESLRRSRASLALALAESDILDRSTRETLAAILAQWLSGERSRPLKTELENATKALAA